MDKATILLNYDKISNIISKLTEITDRLDEMNTREYDVNHSNLQEAWKGDTATMYYSKNEEWRNRMASIKEKLVKVENDLAADALTIRDADLKALELLESNEAK